MTITTRRTRTAILDLAGQLAQTFSERAAKHDAEGSFPYENFEDLRASGYPSLTVPEDYGGWGAGMLDAVMAQEKLATGDGSTALAIAMHVQTVASTRTTAGEWRDGLYAELCREIVERGALMNSCATEPELGSPSRGGKPATTAYRDGDDWVINGLKTFATMSPALDYFIIPAATQGENGEDQVARFLVPRQPGLQIEPTWDAMGMRSTGSHDLRLTDVRVPDRMRVGTSPVGRPDPNRANANAWFVLLFSAVYLGVADAAQDAALRYAHERVPTALGAPIATLESIQRRLGESELALQTARSVLYHTATLWDEQPETREALGGAIIVAKLTVTNAAIQTVDHAMRAVGGSSMTRGLPLERYYRDVRAGLFHPPNDDSGLALLGRLALGRVAPLPPTV